MTKQEKNNWIINIENTVAFISSVLGDEVVKSIINRYGTDVIEKISSSDLSEVFSELYAIEADLRSD